MEDIDYYISAVLLKTGLQKARLDLQNEKVLQQQIYDLFIQAGIECRREVQLSAGNIIDFVSHQIGIEVKINGTKKAIYKQCERYAAHDELLALIVVTNKSIALPSHINNKPTFIINLGQAWL